VSLESLYLNDFILSFFCCLFQSGANIKPCATDLLLKSIRLKDTNKVFASKKPFFFHLIVQCLTVLPVKLFDKCFVDLKEEKKFISD
jgi:hypothetical protein